MLLYAWPMQFSVTAVHVRGRVVGAQRLSRDAQVLLVELERLGVLAHAAVRLADAVQRDGRGRVVGAQRLPRDAQG
jgi:hypothetical protein